MKTEKLVEIRKWLHQHPEVSGNEVKTSDFISKQIKDINEDFTVEALRDHSLIASIGNPKNKHVAFRCELDALPIAEVNNFDHKSTNQGVSHKCGHDGHMTIMLSFASKLKTANLKDVFVSLIFQAAEENGNGAKFVIEQSDLFKNNKPDFIFSLHNIPSYPANQIILKEGVFTPEVRSVKFYLKGKTAHASEPHNGHNPAYVMAQLIEITKSQIEEDSTSSNFNLITPIYAHLGDEAYGIAAGYAELGFTLRSWTKEIAGRTKLWIVNTAEKFAEEQNIELTYEWFDEFGSIDNDSHCCNKIKAAAAELNLSVLEKTEPMPFGEDFGLFTSVCKGAMFGIGAGTDSAALHNPDYDFNDDLIEPASRLFFEILNQTRHD